MYITRLTWRSVLVGLLLAALVVATMLAVLFSLRQRNTHEAAPPSDSVLGAYWQAAVATNGVPCARIGADTLSRGGSAVEAALAALFCEGVACPQSMGLGGGFLMTVYSRETRSAEALNARETAPAAAHRDMFAGDPDRAQRGGLAAGVPGELLGYWEAFQKYKSGNVTWSDLIMPTVQLCEEGIVVTPYLANIFKSMEKTIKEEETLREVFCGADGEVLRAGDLMLRPRLARTLRTIAADGAAAFYHGALGLQYVADVNALGGNLTMDDLREYRVKWEEAVVANLSDGSALLTTPLPGSGPLLAFMLNVLDGFVPADKSGVTWQRIVEAFKFGYGRRTELGDPDFVDVSELVANLTSRAYAEGVRARIQDTHTSTDAQYYGAVFAQPNDHGTAHISVLAPNGDAVSVTSTINLLLGAKVRSRLTGIVLNDEMDDFSAPNITNAFGVPPSPANFIAPGKRPLSSMTPAIVVDAQGDVRLVTGAAGGTKITTATALTIMNTLWFNMTIKEAIDARRLHHQLFPMAVQAEDGFFEDVLKALGRAGHAIEDFAVGGSTVTGVAVRGDAAPYQTVYANADFRRGGSVSGF